MIAHQNGIFGFDIYSTPASWRMTALRHKQSFHCQPFCELRLGTIGVLRSTAPSAESCYSFKVASKLRARRVKNITVESQMMRSSSSHDNGAALSWTYFFFPSASNCLRNATRSLVFCSSFRPA